MQADAARDQRAMASRVVALLALAIFINALDRGNFSTAAPLIKGDLGLTNGEMGVLISAFFWTYVPGMAASGWLVERWGAFRVLAAGLAVWRWRRSSPVSPAASSRCWCCAWCWG